MAIKQVSIDKQPDTRAALSLIRGERRAQLVRFVIDRYEGGVDLSGLSWYVRAVNARGDGDVYALGAATVTEDSLTVDWLVHGVATAAAGETRFTLEGVAEAGGPVVWRNGTRVMKVYEALEAGPAEEEEQLTALQQLILYVNNELPGVLAARDEAAAAVTAARAATADAIEAATGASEAAASADAARQRVEIIGAAADGVTDDTAALTRALNRSNGVVDGGNRRYKYLSVDMAGAENVEVRNVIFTGGQQLNVCGCKNVTFRNCRWENVNNNGENRACYGVMLKPHPDAADGQPGCENVAFYGCAFEDIWYNDLYDGPGHAHQASGQAILPASVHNLTVRDCRFTQVKGSAAILCDASGSLGFVDISDNLFCLNAWGGVCLRRYPSAHPTVNGRVSGNRFIGCGLGYLPDEYLNSIAEGERGAGCAALLDGADAQGAPWRQLTCENNVFIDGCGSSIEGPCWNPCTGNCCYGQGALQDEANCRLMEQKYRLDYPLRVRHAPSVHFICRSLSRNADGSCDPDRAPMRISGNVMGQSYAENSGFILLRGVGFTSPVIITDNVLDVADAGSGLPCTHFLHCDFQQGLRLAGNTGIRPCFNRCTLSGDVVIDDMLSTCESDFSACRLHAPGDRFPQAQLTTYDPAQVLLENDQASGAGGEIVLTALDAASMVAAPTDYAYTIASDAACVPDQGVTFGGSADPRCIDTGLQPLKDGGDFTLFLRFFGDDLAIANSGFYPLFMLYDFDAARGGLILGGRYNNMYTSVQLSSAEAVVDLNTDSRLTRRAEGVKLLMRRQGGQIHFWLSRADADAEDLQQHLVATLDVPASGFDGQTGHLLIGARDGYYGDNTRALSGRMEAFQLFSRALTDAEASMLLYGKNLAAPESPDPSASVIYDLANDERFDPDAGCVDFDGTFDIDTGVELFATAADFTVTARFQLASHHDAGLPNFSFIPVLSAMNYTEDFQNSPGFDVGLSLQQGADPDTRPAGGFVTLRNSGRFSNAALVDGTRYFGYDQIAYSVILIRRDGVLTACDSSLRRLAEISGADADSLFSGTLHIGGNMLPPTLAGDNRLTGRVFECRVYDRALTADELEAMYPNPYSSESRTRGAARFLIPNRRDAAQSVSHVLLDMSVDMGDYAAPAFAGKYPKAVGVQLDGVSDVLWLGAGEGGRLRAGLHLLHALPPCRSYGVRVVNTGLAPGLRATIRGFRCLLLGTERPATDPAAAPDFAIEWDDPALQLPVGGCLRGFLRFLPEGDAAADLRLTADSDAVSLACRDGLLTVTGEAPGEALVTATLPSGATQTYLIRVTDGE